MLSSIPKANNLHTLIWFQVFLSNTYNLQATVLLFGRLVDWLVGWFCSISILMLKPVQQLWSLIISNTKMYLQTHFKQVDTSYT